MKHFVKKGAVNRVEYLFVQDSTSSVGAGKTGLVFNTANLVAYYVRRAAAPVAITLGTQTVTGNFSSGGFVEVDASNMPGLYRVDVPDAAFATGVNKMIMMLKGAANMAQVLAEYQLVDFDPESAASLGLTNLDATVSSRLATVSYNAPLDAAGTRSAVGLATANLDTQFNTVNASLANTATAAALTALTANVALAANLSAGFNTVNASLANVATAANVSAGFNVVNATLANLATTANLAALTANVALAANVSASFNTVNALLANAATGANLAALTANVALAANMSAGFNTVNASLANVATGANLAALSANVALAADVSASFNTVNATLANGATAAAVSSANGAALAAIASANTSGISATGIVFSVVSNLPTALDNVDVFLDRDMGAGVDNGSDAYRTPRQALFAMRNRIDTASGNLTVYKVDDSTISWNAVLTSNASAVPITGVNPG